MPALAEPPDLQPLAAMPVSASDEGSSAEGSVAQQPAYDEPSADISYYSFYREEPQPEATGLAMSANAAVAAQLSSRAVSSAPESGQLSGNPAADPVDKKATALLTAAAASLNAPTSAIRHQDSSLPTAGSPRQEAFTDGETGQCLANGTSAGSRVREALKALSSSDTGRPLARLQALTYTS